MKEGTYLGGIRSVKDIRDRCKVDDETGCWIWSLSFYENAPRINFKLNGKRYSMRGRRAAQTVKTGKIVDPKMICYGLDKCHNSCVNPAHIKVGPKEEFGKALSKSGKLKNVPNKVAAAKKAHSVNNKLTEDQVRIIRMTDRSSRELAEEFGVHRGHIQNIRRGRYWRQGAANSSVFNWMPAA